MKKEKKSYPAKFLRKRKFLVMLPLVFPFLTLMLWSLGVIGAPKGDAKQTGLRGFNINLPIASPSKDSTWDKLKFYEQADKDSAKYQSLLKSDPYFQLPRETDRILPDSAPLLAGNDKEHKLAYDPYPKHLQKYSDPNEEKVYKQLAALNNELNKSSNEHEPDTNRPVLSNGNDPAVSATDVGRLESMMQQMQGTDGGADPQMSQINGMLEKILDIQHPERVNEQIKADSKTKKTQVFPVFAHDQPDNISLLENRKEYTDALTLDTGFNNYPISRQNAFYSLDDHATNTEEQNAVTAIVPENQTIVSGATVKLQLAADVFINGILIPKNQYVFGKASLNGERLMITVNSIRYRNSILPVDLSVYDLDGMEGIYMPGSITRDVTKQSADQAIQGLGIASLDPSLGAQAASAGIQAAKSLIGKKAKLVKMTVKAGYEVLLRDNNQRD